MPDDSRPITQAWDLEIDDRRHRVEVRGTHVREVTWLVDGEQFARKKSGEERVRLTHPDLGSLLVVHSTLGRGRRATWTADPRSAAALTGTGGLDLHPEPGSPAAAYEERVLAHPQRYAALAALGGVAKVVVPILVTLLLARLAFSLPLPRIVGPDLPDVPWPDVPWPDLPDVRWPDWSLPGWLAWLLDKVHFVWPVILAYVLARREIRRRQTQAELRARSVGGRPAATDEEDRREPTED